jgi:spore germination cell wall hydrolase CwlJ-like protein
MFLSAITCIAATVWLEARGEPLDGMAAVADTIMVRAARRDMSPCEVVNEPGQYATGEVNLEYLDAADLLAYDQAREAATMALTGRGLGLTADHFHAASVGPYWADDFALVGRVGDHLFYDSESERAND